MSSVPPLDPVDSELKDASSGTNLLAIVQLIGAILFSIGSACFVWMAWADEWVLPQYRKRGRGELLSARPYQRAMAKVALLHNTLVALPTELQLHIVRLLAADVDSTSLEAKLERLIPCAHLRQMCRQLRQLIDANDRLFALQSSCLIEPLVRSMLGTSKAVTLMVKVLQSLLHGTMDGIAAAQCGWAKRSVPGSELEDTVDRMVAEIARVPLEILMMKKRAINRSANQMGFREMMEINFEMSLAGHFSNTREEWTARLEREGFKTVMQDWKAETVWDRNRNR